MMMDNDDADSNDKDDNDNNRCGKDDGHYNGGHENNKDVDGHDNGSCENNEDVGTNDFLSLRKTSQSLPSLSLSPSSSPSS